MDDAMPNRTRKGHNSEDTKKKLIEAGVELFARYSYDGVSTRNLADRARVNLASIQYYFGSKEGLYSAVARHIVEEALLWIDPLISRINLTISDTAPSSKACFLLLCELMDNLLSHVLTDSQPKKWMGIFMREQIEPTKAFDILYEGVMGPIHHCLCRLIAGIFHMEPGDQETKVKAFAVAGQIFMFHISRAEISRAMHWEGYGADAIELVLSIVLEHVRAVAGMPHEALEEYHAARRL
jgi:AcrR family transcriptional regulator